NDMPAVVTWIPCVFLSILVHEYGHGLVAKSLGCAPSILIWGPGLCYYAEMERQRPLQRLAVILSGPGAGFALCGVVMLVVSAIFGLTPGEHLSVVQRLLGLSGDGASYMNAQVKLGIDQGETRFLVYWFLVQINILWSLLNLLPVWPLDGGQASET